MIAFDVGIEKKQIAAPNLHAPDFGADRSAAGFDLYSDWFAVRADRRFHGQLADIGLDIFFLLPASAVETLAEISLAIEQADCDQGNSQVGGALDVIACEYAEPARIFRDRNVQTEFGGEIRHRTGPQDAGMSCPPGAVGVEIFPLAAVGVIDPAVQHQFASATLNHCQR